MSKEKFAAILNPPEPIGAIEAVKEGIQAIAPGLSLSKILNDIGKELKEQAAHGAHEMASALFRGDAFVMYPRTGQNQVDEPQHGLPIEAMKQPEVKQEQSRQNGDVAIPQERYPGATHGLPGTLPGSRGGG